MGALGQGGFRLGAWDGVEGGVSHGGTEGTEVGARMSRGFRRGAWGGLERGVSHGGGEISRDIPVMCKGSIE